MFSLTNSQVIFLGKIGFYFPDITLTTEFPGSKWDFQVANLLLATLNFKPCPYILGIPSKDHARLHSTVSSMSDSRASGPGFDSWSSHILSFFLPLIQEKQLSVTGKSVCMKYWLTGKRSKPA